MKEWGPCVVKVVRQWTVQTPHRKMKYVAHKLASGDGADLLRLRPSNEALRSVSNYVRRL